MKGHTMKHRFNYRTQYETARDIEEGDAAATVNTEDSLTQQHFLEDTDINVLAKRFGLDKAQMPEAPFNPGFYGDFSDVPDLRTAMDLVRDATNKFMDLPAKLRERFDNNPAKMWHFVNDPENGDEAVRLGLLKRLPDKQEDAPPATPTDTTG